MYSLSEISMAREISAAVVNVSGRQRMLSQRTAFFCLRLVCSQSAAEREKLRSELLDAIVLMEKSHKGLIEGDPSVKLAGNPSKEIEAMYFEPPLNLDRQLRDYIREVRALAAATDAELTKDNPHLRYIMNAASTELLAALDAVVSQYQKESEAEQQAIDRNQLALVEQSCAATAAARARTLELQQALRDLQEAQSLLVQSEKMSSLGQLLAGVAHEINNPVTFIYGNLSHAINYVSDLSELLQLYRQRYPDPGSEIEELIESLELDFLIEDLPKVMSSMKMGADRIRQIVLSLRNFSRMNDAEISRMDIHEGIENTLLILHNRLKPQAGRPGIQAVKEFGNLPLVECCAGSVNQVFMNILANAIDALEEGMAAPARSSGKDNLCPMPHAPRPTPTIRIRTEVLRPDGVAVRIADNGPGMEPEVLAQLFDPFFTTKPAGKGTGLGLSISYQIVVEKHGGTLKCLSEPGQGTEFWVELPVRHCPSPASGTESQSDRLQPAARA
ncbi:MAG: type IV pili methyl-accepting chemotaxis transducer N-terminal domain-containing protein [Oscillatoria princeps RMCB-10]|jgi:signal transduction histidine kinase|nr:type IV pili methyl-accepting chemotaxis transducer N-terminal domain-containing protein [Oscillatoria princeps RMCB-10]